MSGFKAVGTRVYAESGSLVRSFDTRTGHWDGQDSMDDLHRRIRQARRFTAALNGVGPRSEHARRKAGI